MTTTEIASNTMMPVTRHFLLAFDYASNTLVHMREFTDMHEAVTEYEQLEEQYWDSPSVNVVLVGSDSLESVKITHSTYFPSDIDFGNVDSMRKLLAIR